MQQLEPPYFYFPPIPPLDSFSFEPLTTSNFQHLYLMFEADDSSFTDNRFRTYQGAFDYAVALECWGTTSPKHGGQDWLVKEGSEYIGILHLYDLSLEPWNENDRRCWIGFATKPEKRRRGITLKVLVHFIYYIIDAFPQMRYIHAMTLAENQAARRTLHALAFFIDPDPRDSKDHVFYRLPTEPFHATAGRSNVL